MCLNNLDVSSTYVNMISLSYAGHEFEMQHKFMILTAVNNLRKLNVESWTQLHDCTESDGIANTS